MSEIGSAMGAIAAGLVLFLVSTIVFDGVHFLLHRCMDSRWRLLRWAGSLHATHHEFLDNQLRIRLEHQRANLARHVVPEFLTQATFSAVCLLFIPGVVVGIAFAVQVMVFLVIARAGGLDINHRSIPNLAAYRPMFFCLPPYHALHHVHPTAHFSSWIKALDYLLGTGVALQGKRVSVMGDSPLLVTLCERLEIDWDCRVERFAESPGGVRSDVLPASLARAELLIAAAPAGRTEDGLLRAWLDGVEQFCDDGARRQIPVEVWRLRVGGSDELADPLRAMDRYYYDERVYYRLLETPAGASESWDARASEEVVARWLFWLRRGFHFIPDRGFAAGAARFRRFRRARANESPATAH